MDNVTVRPFEEGEEGEAGDSAAWDAYVQSHPRATFFHQIGWKRVLEATFSYPSHYLVAERDGAVLGQDISYYTPAGSWTIVKDDYDAALALAREQNKLLLVNFTGVT